MDLYKKKRMIKNITTHNYQQLNLKQKQKQKQKNKLSKQLEQEQIHRNGDHMKGYQWGVRGGRMGNRYRE